MARHFWRFFKRAIILAIAASAIAILPTYAQLDISPESISVSGSRADQISLRLTLSDSREAATLRTAVSDLRRADGKAFFPAEKIIVAPQDIDILVDAPAQINLSANLDAAKASGEFFGSLYLYREGERRVIPIVLRVKARLLWPWTVMIVGVLLGTGLSLYRTEGRARDEIIVQTGRLRTQMRGDGNLDHDFQAGIEAELLDVEAAIEDRNWEVAKAKILEAKALWQRWRKGREDWIAQLENAKKFVSKHFDSLDEATRSTVYMQGVKDQIDMIYRRLRAGQCESPQTLRDAFSEVRRLLIQYSQGDSLLQRLRQTRASASLPREREQVWLHQLKFLETKLQTLELDRDSFQSWYSEAEQVETELNTEVDQQSPQARVTKGVTARSLESATVASPVLPAAPPVGTFFSVSQTAQAAQKLAWFNWISRSVAIALLAWLGMTELYVSNATFGADPLRDYFALIAWGFGAELTRESVLRATQDLGLPSTK